MGAPEARDGRTRVLPSWRPRLWAIAASVLLAVSCSGSPSPPDRDRLTVATNVYALKWVTERVGGDLVDVRQLDAEVHHEGELGQGDKDLLDKADLIIYVGNLSQSVRERIESRGNPERLKDLAKEAGVSLLPADPQLEGVERIGGNSDPHFWLDPTDRMTSTVAAVQRFLFRPVNSTSDGEANRKLNEVISTRTA